ncbi:MAG: 50S ribosomal protein L29 [Myxococcota bacterium]|nr:50S ribosomal protein L29 [Myxococcota bacterium]
MNTEDLRGLTKEELLLAEKNKAEELFKLRFQHHTGQLQDTASVRTARRDLARIKTIITERDKGIGIAPGEG